MIFNSPVFRNTQWQTHQHEWESVRYCVWWSSPSVCSSCEYHTPVYCIVCDVACKLYWIYTEILCSCYKCTNVWHYTRAHTVVMYGIRILLRICHIAIQQYYLAVIQYRIHTNLTSPNSTIHILTGYENPQNVRKYHVAFLYIYMLTYIIT